MSHDLISDPLDHDATDLGECCGCGKRGRSVNAIVMLPFRGPVPGRGWGCVTCGLPLDGAYVVMCEDCLATQVEPTHFCRGYPAEGRIPLEGFERVPFDHDFAKHPEIVRHCRLCGCTDDRACVSADGPCYWVEFDLCSQCAFPRPAAEAALDQESEW